MKLITLEHAGLSIHSRHLLYADLSNDDVCEALGITIHSPSPLLDLCRALVEAGCDPATPLEAYRGDVLCLRVRSIGEAAKLKVGSDGKTKPSWKHSAWPSWEAGNGIQRPTP